MNCLTSLSLRDPMGNINRSHLHSGRSLSGRNASRALRVLPTVGLSGGQWGHGALHQRISLPTQEEAFHDLSGRLEKGALQESILSVHPLSGTRFKWGLVVQLDLDPPKAEFKSWHCHLLQVIQLVSSSASLPVFSLEGDNTNLSGFVGILNELRYIKNLIQSLALK